MEGAAKRLNIIRREVPMTSKDKEEAEEKVGLSCMYAFPYRVA